MPEAAKRARRPSPRVRVSPAPLPDAPAPMLASLAAEPFDHPDWISEPKYDGLRVLARFDGEELTLISRNGKAQSFQFPEVADAVRDVGTGYTREALLDLRDRLGRIETDRSPFAAGDPPRGGQVHWVRPKYVAEIGFAEWTQNGLLRQPRFEGLREDKPARQVRRERPTVSAE